jgi:PAS domain S-box-containing protein
MTNLAKPRNESERLRSLESYQILDTPAESHFDEITKTASIFCGCEVSLIGFAERDRLWLKSKQGIEGPFEVDRDKSVCGHVVARNEMIIVEDIEKDKSFFSPLNDFETSRLRFYAGVPLNCPDGHTIGTLCVADSKSKSLNDDQKLLLKTLAKQVMNYLELRKSNQGTQKQLQEVDIYKKALDTHALVSRTDAQGKIIYVNEKFCEVTKFSRSEILGRDYSFINSGHHDKEFFKKLWECIQGGDVWRGEIRNIARDGEHFWIDSSIVPIKKADGEIHEFMSIAYDMTAKKESEQLYSETQKIARIGGWEINISSLQVKWTEETYKIHGIAIGSTQSIKDAILFYPEHERPRVRKCVDDCIQNGVPYSEDFEFVTATGKKRWVHTRGTPEYGAEGNVIKVIGTFQDVTDQKLKEQELVKKTEGLELSQSISRLGFWEFDLINQVSTWSKEMFNIFPVNIEEGTPGIEENKTKIHKDDVGAWEYAIQECSRNGTAYQITFRTHQKGDLREEVWIESRGNARKDQNGKITSLFGTCQDVTERESYKSEILRQKSLMSGLLDDMPHIIWYKDHDQRIVFVNQKYADFFGKPKEQFIGKTISDIYPGGKGIFFHQKEREVFLSQKVDQYETRIDLGGRPHYYKNTQFPIFDHQGECIGTGGVVEDVTNSRETERDLHLVLENNKIGLWQYNPITNEFFWDQSMYELYEVDNNSHVNAYEIWKDALYESYAETTFKLFEEALIKNDCFDTAFKIKTKNGVIKDVGARAIIERNDQGDAVFVTGANWDRTDEQLVIDKMNRQAQIAQRQAKLASIGELAAGVGHEINNPLAIIKGVSSSLDYSLELEKVIEPSLLKDSFQKVDIAVERISNIVRGLRTYSRSDPEQSTDFIPVQAVEESFDLIKDIYRHEGVKLTFVNNVSNARLVACGSRGRFQQILMNLISNAKDSLGGSGHDEVIITLNQKGPQLELKVRDFGQGIAAEILEKIYDPFFTTKDVDRGTGIGLSVVYNYVQELGGEIHIESELGIGTECTVSIPVISREGSGVIEKEAQFHSYDLSAYDAKVILVDDEETFREIFADILKSMGLEVTAVGNGKEAYDIFLSKPESFDVILSDVRMPIMDGPSLIKKVRSDKEIKQPGIILMTGGVNMDLRSDEDELVPLLDGHLFKPFNKEKIFNILKDYLEARSHNMP